MAPIDMDYHAPSNLKQLLSLKAELGSSAAVLAGGTDLVVRMNQKLALPAALVSLKNLTELSGIDQDPVNIIIGAGTPLAQVIADPLVAEELPGLKAALESIGHPTCQHYRGTIGGNLLLEPRCWFYNQSSFWRQGHDRCFKAGGQVCLALPDSKECSAANQSDGAPMLVALSAQVKLASTNGERLIPAAQLYTGKGEEPFTLAPEEVVTQIRIPRPAGQVGQAYVKIRQRSYMDYPLISAAAVVGFSGSGQVDKVRLVVGAAGPAPVVIDRAEAILKGQAPTEELIAQAAAEAQTTVEGVIVNNAGTDEEYRRQMVEVATRRALAKAALTTR